MSVDSGAAGTNAVRASSQNGFCAHPIARDHSQHQKTTQFWLLFGPWFHTIEPQFIRMLGIIWGKETRGVRMRGSRRWSAGEKELERTIPIFRAAPGEVLAEREAAWAAELTPNMVVLGDPLPGRSALDAKYRTSLH